MAKKDRNLTIGVEADTSEAQKAVAALGTAAGAASEAAANGTDRMAAAAERSARALERGANASRSTSESMSASARQITRIATSMTGMMVGLAAKYASHRVGQDTALGAGLEYGGNALSQGGAMAATGAAVGGGVGAVVGGVVGVGKGLAETWIDRDNRQIDAQKAIAATAAENRKLIDTMLEAEKRTEAFRKVLSGFGDEKVPVGERISSIEEALSSRRERERELRGGLMAESGVYADKDSAGKFKDLMRERSSVMGEIAQLEKLLEHLQQGGEPAEARSSTAALDSLARVGGDFAGADGGFRELQKINEKQVQVLERIERKAGKGVGRF